MSDPLETWLNQRGLTLDDDPPRVRGLGLELALTPILRNEWTHRLTEDPDGLEDDLRTMVNAVGVPEGWWVARSGLRLLLMSRPTVPDDVLHLPLSERAAAVLVHTDPDESLITLLRKSHLETWHVGLEEAHEAALAGLDRVLADAELEVQDAGGSPLGMLATHSPFKASLLLAPALRGTVEGALGWPVHAVAPCRDFLFVFGDPDLVPKLGGPVMHEYESSAHPVSNEVFRVGDEGLEALGAYGPM